MYINKRLLFLTMNIATLNTLAVVPSISTKSKSSNSSPDQALNHAILQAPMEKPSFPQITRLAHSSMLHSQEANAAFSRITRKRKAVETFEKQHKNDLSGKSRNALASYRNDLVKATEDLKQRLNTISNLFKNAEKHLEVALKSHKNTLKNLTTKHIATNKILAQEAPTKNSLESDIEELAHETLEKFEKETQKFSL